MEQASLLFSSQLMTLLFMCVVLQGFALVLRQRAGGPSRRCVVEEKAVALLKEWLSPAQLEDYERNGHFEVTGSHSGKRYRIRPGRALNVDELDEDGESVALWCFVPQGDLPIADVMLAQKIALENKEQFAIALANRGSGIGMRRSGADRS